MDMPGMGMDNEPVDTSKLYKQLGVEKDASKSEIKKAYFKLARAYHPDRQTGDEEKFKEIQRAYEILSDEHKRAVYDRSGEKGLDNNMGSPNASELKRPEDIELFLDLTLKDVCLGAKHKLSYEIRTASRQTVCEKCHGRGMTLGGVEIRPGLVIRAPRQCISCNGKGTNYKDEKEMKVRKEALIPKGVKSGDKIKLSGDGHNLPGMEPGNVVIHCRVAKDAYFERIGADLAIKKQLTLNEALCGFKFEVRHPSGTKLIIESGKNKVTK